MGDISSPLPCHQAADLGLYCRPHSMGTGMWKGLWLMWGYQGVVPTIGAGGGLSILRWLSIPQMYIPPGSGSAGAALAPRKHSGRGGASLLPIHHPYQAELSAQWSLAAGLHGRQAGAVQRETSRRHGGDKQHCKQTQQLPSLGTSKHQAEIYVATEPLWVLGGGGQHRVGMWEGCGARTTVCPCGAVDLTVSCGM